MRTFIRSLFGALAFAAVVIIGATALATSDATARPLGSHMHGHGHHGGHMHGGRHMHGHHGHSFRHFRSHRYHYRHYRHWHRHWHWRWHRYRHWHRYNYWYRYDRPYYRYDHGYDYGYRGYRYPSYGSGGGSSAPAPTARQSEPCNCLTKEYLPNGSVLFMDRCTKEEAIAPAGRR